MTRVDFGALAIGFAMPVAGIGAAILLFQPDIPGWLGAAPTFALFFGLLREGRRLGGAPAPASQGSFGVQVTTPALTKSQAELALRETYAFAARLEALL